MPALILGLLIFSSLPVTAGRGYLLYVFPEHRHEVALINFYFSLAILGIVGIITIQTIYRVLVRQKIDFWRIVAAVCFARLLIGRLVANFYNAHDLASLYKLGLASTILEVGFWIFFIIFGLYTFIKRQSTPSVSVSISGQKQIRVRLFLAIVTAFILLMLGLNASVGWQAFAVINGDTRNEGIRVLTYRPYLINPNGLVIDIWQVEGKAPIDVTRVLFQIAERFKDRNFSEVRLAYHGETRFLIPPGRFRTIGQEYGLQNPVYTIRTLPEDLLLPDGSHAYGRWTGGWLGVMNKQMDDYTDFCNHWFRG